MVELTCRGSARGAWASVPLGAYLATLTMAHCVPPVMTAPVFGALLAILAGRK